MCCGSSVDCVEQQDPSLFAWPAWGGSTYREVDSAEVGDETGVGEGAEEDVDVANISAFENASGEHHIRLNEGDGGERRCDTAAVCDEVSEGRHVDVLEDEGLQPVERSLWEVGNACHFPESTDLDEVGKLMCDHGKQVLLLGGCDVLGDLD